MTTPASKEFEANTPYVCGWSTSSCCDTLNTADQAVAQRAVDQAAEILYALSGRQFGLCEFTIRPCRPDCCDGPCDMGGYRWTPVLSGGQWTNVSCGTCDYGCSCSRVCEVVLPGPIFDVTQVRLDGVVLDPRDYRVDDHRTLVRTGHHVPVSGTFHAEDGVATLGNLRITGYDFVNVSNWLGSLWSSPPDTVTVEAAGAGDTITVIFGPGDEIAWSNDGWIAEDVSTQAGSSVTFDGQVATGAGASPLVRFTLPEGATTGTITGFQRNPNTTGFSLALGTSTGNEPACWPTCQDMTADADQDNTWEVTYRRGKPLPESGRAALAEFACEIAKKCIGDKTCCLPERVTTMTRQGISMALLDPQTFLTEGRTGLYAVDAWLAAVNPRKRTRPAGIYSPDMPLGRHTSG